MVNKPYMVQINLYINHHHFQQERLHRQKMIIIIILLSFVVVVVVINDDEKLLRFSDSLLSVIWPFKSFISLSFDDECFMLN